MPLLKRCEPHFLKFSTRKMKPNVKACIVHSMRMRRRSWKKRGPRSASLARLASLARRTPTAGLPMPRSMWKAQAERGVGLLLGRQRRLDCIPLNSMERQPCEAGIGSFDLSRCACSRQIGELCRPVQKMRATLAKQMRACPLAGLHVCG